MNDKVAIITGASSGIGRAAALLFSVQGMKVAAVGRNEKELGLLRDEAQAQDGSFKVSLADILETSQVDRLINETVESFGRIDV
ncbi:MAG TPA: SDR family NAD(P)-dependent oxidoreductase, partial [Pyrinomonadaceae bacterium]